MKLHSLQKVNPCSQHSNLNLTDKKKKKKKKKKTQAVSVFGGNYIYCRTMPFQDFTLFVILSLFMAGSPPNAGKILSVCVGGNEMA